MALSYRTIGIGDRRVIALHGWLGDHRAYEGIWPWLDQDRFAWAFMDYRGYGGARAVTGEHTMDEIAADVLALAGELGWERFSLVGHSMGGMAIQRVLVEAGSRVERMVGLNPVPASGVPFDDQGWALFSGAAHNPAHRRAIIDLTTGNRLAGTWLDHMAARSVECSEPEAVADYLTAWAKTDFHLQVEGNPVPAKAIVGEHDPALSADVMRQTWLAWYPNAELEVMANAGHYPMDEVPIATATSIQRFLGA